MQSDYIQGNINQSVKSEFSTDGRIISLLNFLEKYLPEFLVNINIERNTHEEIINQKLFRFILHQNPVFNFIPENRDETGENKSKPDLGVYDKFKVYDDNQIRFFDIECKRLYDVNKSKEYVSGSTGGIQRFKENKHGVDLPYSAMIGYIEIEDFNFWHNKVNSWISEKAEYLKTVEIKKMAKLKSKHKRYIEKTSIELIHFWLNFNKTE